MKIKLLFIMSVFSFPLLGQSDYTKFIQLKKLFIEEKFSDLIKSEIDIKKNIPHGSGLGSGSSNAASLLNFLNKNFFNIRIFRKVVTLLHCSSPFS